MSERKAALYGDLAAQLAALLDGESDPLANAANTAALVYHGLPDVNWAGFYLARSGELVLGPFQGKPACVRIARGPGCLRRSGGAARKRRRAGCACLSRPHRLRPGLVLRAGGAADRG